MLLIDDKGSKDPGEAMKYLVYIIDLIKEAQNILMILIMLAFFLRKRKFVVTIFICLVMPSLKSRRSLENINKNSQNKV